MEPANDLAGPQQLDGGIQRFLAGVMQGIAGFHIVEDVLDFCAREDGPPIHRADFRVARLAHLLMPNPGGRAQRTSCVAGSGRNENIPHAKLALQRSHEKRVVKYAASEADLLKAGFLLKGCEQVGDQLRDSGLHAAGKISFLRGREL